MLDSFIIGALTSLVFGIFYYGWKFFRLKEPTKKQLMTRIVVSSIFLIFNLIMIIGNIFTTNSIKEDDIGFMIITILIFLAISIGLGILLVKDIEKYSLIKNESTETQKDNAKSTSLSSDNLEENCYLEYGIYLLTQFIDEDKITQKFKSYRVIIGDFLESSINKTTKEIYICDKDNKSEVSVKETILKFIRENKQSSESNKPVKIAPLSEEKSAITKNNCKENVDCSGKEEYRLEDTTNIYPKDRTVMIIVSIIMVVVVGFSLTIYFLTREKNNKVVPETLTASEQELVGTYKFLEAQYTEVNRTTSKTYYYPNGPTYFNEAAETYLNSKIILSDKKTDDYISGSLVLSDATHEFKWTRYSTKMIKLSGSLTFIYGNDKDIFTDYTSIIFIADDLSYINITIIYQGCTVIYYFEKV